MKNKSELLLENRVCKRCGVKVTNSELEEYSFSCDNCDEDLFTFETEIVKGAIIVRRFGFMHTNGDLEAIEFTEKQIQRGELREHIEYMKEDGFTFMGEEVTTK